MEYNQTTRHNRRSQVLYVGKDNILVITCKTIRLILLELAKIFWWDPTLWEFGLNNIFIYNFDS